MRESEPEALFAFQVRAAGLPPPVRELRFHVERRWRFDFAWPSVHLAVEVEGGTWAGGRHGRGAGFEADCEKYAEALCAGWRVLRVTTRQVRSGEALAWLTELLKRS